MPESSADKAPTKHATPMSPYMMKLIEMPKTPKIINRMQIAFIVFFFSFCPFFVHGKERGRNLRRVSGEAVGCPVRSTEEKAPIGRILHSASALTGRNSYISPEPKRCVERTALNCLARIIAYFSPDVARACKKRAGKSKTRLFFHGKSRPCLYAILPLSGKISREKSHVSYTARILLHVRLQDRLTLVVSQLNHFFQRCRTTKTNLIECSVV